MWADLPDEVVYLIAEHCGIKALARLAQIDRRTHAVARDDRLWQNLCRMRAEVDPTCPAGPACARRRGRDYANGLTDRVRHWLATDARECQTDRAPSGPAAPPPPWSWDVFTGGDPVGGCVCHVPRDDGDDTCDHRWLYASSLTPPVTYRAGPGRKPQRVGRIVDMADWQWHPLPLLGWSVSGKGAGTRRVCTYSGEVDAQDQPHGRGTLTVWARAHPKRDRGVGPTAANYRMAGCWSHGAAEGVMRVFNYGRGGQVVYFDGTCDSGRPHGRGLAVLCSAVYDGKWNPPGYPTGAGLFCSARGLVRYGRHRGSLHALMHHIVLRPDGSVACEDTYTDPYDDHCDEHGHDVDSDDSDDESDSGEGGAFQSADADALVAKAAAACDRDVRAYSAPVGEGYTVLRDRDNKVIYTGLLGVDLSPRPRQGTAFLPGGGHVSYIGRTKFAARRLVTIAYAAGDRVTCLVSTSSLSDTPVVLAFTFSSRALPPFTGRTIRGPWHVLSAPSLDPTPGVHPDHRSQSNDDMDEEDAEDQDNDHTVVSIDACPDDMVVTHLAQDPPPPKGLDAMRALADIVFWPVARGEERDAFFDHMAARYGSRWAACRAIADTISSW